MLPSGAPVLLGFLGLIAQGLCSDVTDNQPMVAFMCGKPAMHLRTKEGTWVADNNKDCLHEASEILDYCKELYPELDIKNVVEATHTVTIDNWCRAKHEHCRHHGSHTVRPFKCLVGAFQSEALLVPDHCVFDHFHDTKSCKSFQEWNETSISKCSDRDMVQQSFAILLPCESPLSTFAGVEFVCCPQQKDDVTDFLEHYQLGSEDSSDEENEKDDILEPESEDDGALAADDDEYIDDDDEDSWDDEDDSWEYDEDEAEFGPDEFEDEDYSESDEGLDDEDDSEDAAPVQPTFIAPETAPVPAETTSTDLYTAYLQGSQNQAHNEHDNFGNAKDTLMKHHHEKVTKMMKEWAAARQRVQEMKAADPKAADKLNREITARFQKTYEALEQEGAAEKKQLVALHQQRVQAELNEKKRHAMEHYMEALQKTSPDAATVTKALKHYIKCEQKDRMHSINHYKHLRDTDPVEAERIREQTLSHLAIIDQRIEQSREMLNRVPNFAQKVQLEVEDFLQQFRDLDTDIAALLVRPEPHVENPPRTDAPAEINTDTPVAPEDDQDEAPSTVRTVQASTEEEDVYHLPVEKLAPVHYDDAEVRYDDETMEDERAFVEIKPAHVAHAGADTLSLESNYISKSHMDGSRMSLRTGSTLGLAIGCIAVFVVIVVGVVVLRRRVHRRPVNHGFVEVDQAASPEERHVANMQINGYENPTYKYFEMPPKV